MVFHKQALLTKAEEHQLKTEMLPLWLSGMKGKNIAEKLQLGVEGTKYAKVRQDYVYFYRQKFNDDETDKEFFGKFVIRNNSPFAKGTSRYKVQPDVLGIMTIEEFILTLNKNCPSTTNRPSTTYKNRKLRAFLTILFHTPLRCSEVIERIIDNFEINENEIIIHLLRKKKKKDRKVKDEPITIRRNFPLMKETAEFLINYKEKNKKKKDRALLLPFDYSSWSAWHNTKKVFDGFFPHFFRFNYITRQASKPNTGITKIKSKTHLTADVINRYIMTNAKTEKEVDDTDEEEYRKKGLLI